MPRKRRVECPHCGNEMIVSDLKDTVKCCWCKRLMSVRFAGKGKKASVIVEAIDFPTKRETPFNEFKSYDSWKDEDIYGN